MSPLAHSRNIAARMGRWSAAHRRTAIVGWLAFVLVAFSLGIFMPMQTIEDTDRGVGESGRADAILEHHFNTSHEGLGEFVVVQSDTAHDRRPRVPPDGGGRDRRCRRVRRGQDIRSPYDEAESRARSRPTATRP